MQVKKTSLPAGRPRSEATRRQILDAAISLLQDKSIQAISIEAIAREAGVSRGDHLSMVGIQGFCGHRCVY
jgi:AcrR family transcriptional regulator